MESIPTPTKEPNDKLMKEETVVKQNNPQKLVDVVKLSQQFSMGSVNSGSWLVSWIRQRIKVTRPANIVFVGETGSSKSYSAMSLASVIDPNFDVDKRVVFDIKSFLHIINERPPPGSVIMYDEAGVDLGNKDYHAEQVILFGKTAQTMRYRGILVFYTIPKRSFLDNTTRQLIQMMLEATGERGVFKMFLIKPSSDRNDNKAWYKYPTETITQNYHTYTVRHETVRFAMPPKRLYIPYEIKKDMFLTPFFEETEKRLSTKVGHDGKQTLEFGVHLECKSCGYGFQYKKSSWTVKCPRCGVPMAIDPELKPFVGISHAPLVYKERYDVIDNEENDEGDNEENKDETDNDEINEMSSNNNTEN